MKYFFYLEQESLLSENQYLDLGNQQEIMASNYKTYDLQKQDHLGLDHLGLAIAAYSNAIIANPYYSSSDTYFRRSRVYVTEGNYPHAKRDLITAVLINSRLKACYQSLISTIEAFYQDYHSSDLIFLIKPLFTETMDDVTLLAKKITSFSPLPKHFPSLSLDLSRILFHTAALVNNQKWLEQLMSTTVFSDASEQQELVFELLKIGAERGHVSLINSLLKIAKKNIENMKAVFFTAALYDSIDVVKFLLSECSADITDKDKFTALKTAFIYDCFHVFKYLIENNKQIINMLTEDKGLGLIHIAAERRDKYTLRYLLEHGADINLIGGSKGYAPIHITVENSDNHTMEYLLDQGADVNLICRTNGYAPLHLALEKGNDSLVRLLLQYGALANLKPHSSRLTPILIALEKGSIDLVKSLLEYGVKIYRVFPDGKMPLQVAAEKRHWPMVEYLISHHFDINGIKNTKLDSLTLEDAITKGYRALVQHLVAKRKKSSDEEVSMLLGLASQHGNFDLVQDLIASGANPNAVCNKISPLAWAIKNSDYKLTKYLLEQGANFFTTEVLRYCCITARISPIDGLVNAHPLSRQAVAPALALHFLIFLRLINFHHHDWQQIARLLMIYWIVKCDIPYSMDTFPFILQSLEVSNLQSIVDIFKKDAPQRFFIANQYKLDKLPRNFFCRFFKNENTKLWESDCEIVCDKNEEHSDVTHYTAAR